MLAALRRLGLHSLIYGLGGTLSQVVGFLLVPVYTRVLTPDDYGTMAVLGTAMAIVNIVFQCGVSGSVTRYYHEFEQAERRRFIGSVLLCQLACTGLVTAAVVLGARGAAELLLPGRSVGLLLQLAITRVFVSLVAVVPGVTLRMREQPWWVVATSLLGLVTDTGLSIYLVVFLRLGLLGVYLGGLASSLICLPVYAYLLGHDVHLGVEWRHVRTALVYGLPLVPHMLAHWVINLSDRVLLQRLASTSAAGLYSLGYNFGMIMQFIVGTINTAWVPYFYQLNRERGEEEARAQTGRLFTYYAAVVGFLGLLLALFGGDLLRLMAGRAFWPAAQVIPVIVATYLVQGLYFMTVNGIFLKNRTPLLPAITGLAAVVNVGLNLLLIPRLGMMGAAWGTLAAFLVLTALTVGVAQRLYPVPFERRRVAKVALVYLLVWGACQTLVPAAPAALTTPLRLLAVACAPLLLLACGFANEVERRRLGRLLAGRSRAA